jgi:protein SCO1/2
MLSKRRLLVLGSALILAGCSEKAPAPSAIGGPFTLVDQDGKARTEAMLKGKWTALYFGYTYCPDVCPTTLTAIAEAKKQLGPKGDRLQVVLLSVDPDRDTPKQLKVYLDNEAFPPGTIGLTGSQAQVAAAAKAFRVYYRKAGEGEAYAVDHASMIYLMDPKGRFSRPIGYGTPPQDIARIVGEAMGKGA